MVSPAAHRALAPGETGAFQPGMTGLPNATARRGDVPQGRNFLSYRAWSLAASRRQATRRPLRALARGQRLGQERWQRALHTAWCEFAARSSVMAVGPGGVLPDELTIVGGSVYGPCVLRSWREAGNGCRSYRSGGSWRSRTGSRRKLRHHRANLAHQPRPARAKRACLIATPRVAAYAY